jgi:transcriptional regulator with XRE-family HTH domain
VTPDDIKALRKKLACTAKELAAVLGVDQATVLAWEKAALFPTKAYVDHMADLLARGPGAVPRKAAKATHPGDAQKSPMETLADPLAWELFRKIIANKRLRDEVAKLAENYPDPARD